MYLDYRFWDDPADEFKEGVGTLLPLWKFTYDKARRMTVTDIRCNPWYYDLFGVTFGSCKQYSDTRNLEYWILVRLGVVQQSDEN